MYPFTLALTAGWIWSATSMVFRVVITYTKSDPVGLLNKPKTFFKAASYDHNRISPIVSIRFTVVECQLQIADKIPERILQCHSVVKTVIR